MTTNPADALTALRDALQAEPARIEALISQYGCNRCWSDDLRAPCTCDSERNAMRSALLDVLLQHCDDLPAEVQAALLTAVKG